MKAGRYRGCVSVNQRNAVLTGGTGTGIGKSHLAIETARACIRGGAHGCFLSVVDLVNRLDSEARDGRQNRVANRLSRLDLGVLDEIGYGMLRQFIRRYASPGEAWTKFRSPFR